MVWARQGWSNALAACSNAFLYRWCGAGLEENIFGGNRERRIRDILGPE